ncbi:hypothetical protein QTN25_001302 [Entamoeba marina]
MDLLEEMSILSQYCYYLEELYGKADLSIAENILAVIKKCKSSTEFINKFTSILPVDDPHKLTYFYDIYNSTSTVGPPKSKRSLNSKEHFSKDYHHQRKYPLDSSEKDVKHQPIENRQRGRTQQKNSC